jgi:CRP-like cAMP-binding protein
LDCSQASANPSSTLLNRLLRRAHYEKGSVIFREGDPGDELLIVTNGTASAYLQLPQMTTPCTSAWP